MLTESIEQLQDVLNAGRPEASDEPVPADLTPWRDRIDALDGAIIHLLNERASCAIAIGHIKKAMHMPVYVPAREEQVLQNVMHTNPGPLQDQAVRRLYERIIDETRSLERQMQEAGRRSEQEEDE